MLSAKGQRHAKINTVTRSQEQPWRTESGAASQLPNRVPSLLSSEWVLILQMAVRAALWRPVTNFGVQSLDYRELYVTQLSMRIHFSLLAMTKKWESGGGVVQR